jgi:hypothetical protein
MPHVRLRLLSLLIAGLFVVWAAGAAQAGAMTVTAAVKSQDRIVKDSAAYRSLKHIDANTPAAARRLVTAFRALQLRVEHAATVVSRASASGARQKLGQRDWVDGVRDLARGIGQLDVALEDIIHGRNAAGKAELLRAKRTLAVANALGTRGKRLLGIPANE